MKTIWKFELPITDSFSMPLPLGAKFLSVQTQYGTPQSWWLIDTDAVKRPRRFRVHGTGHEVYLPIVGLVFLGTFQLTNGSLVFHLFEET